MPLHIKNSQNKLTFKNSLRNVILKTDSTFKKNFNYGNRRANILHCRLRNRASSLNYDLFCANLNDSPSCTCGFVCEDFYHYFFQCPLFTAQRNVLFQELYWYNNISSHTFKYGDIEIDEKSNFNLFHSIHKFIISSKRFK